MNVLRSTMPSGLIIVTFLGSDSTWGGWKHTTCIRLACRMFSNSDHISINHWGWLRFWSMTHWFAGHASTGLATTTLATITALPRKQCQRESIKCPHLPAWVLTADEATVARQHTSKTERAAQYIVVVAGLLKQHTLESLDAMYVWGTKQ